MMLDLNTSSNILFFSQISQVKIICFSKLSIYGFVIGRFKFLFPKCHKIFSFVVFAHGQYDSVGC